MCSYNNSELNVCEIFTQYNNLLIQSKTLPNIQKAQSEFGRNIEKRKPYKERRTIVHHCAVIDITAAVWTAAELDRYKQTQAPTHITNPC